MSQKNILCTARNGEQAIRVLYKVRMHGFSRDDVSVLYANPAPSGADVEEGSIGSSLRKAVAWLTGVGSLVVPGVGTVIAAGPIMSLLKTAEGGIPGSLAEMGIPELEANWYEGKIKAEGVLVAVHSEYDHRIERAEELFEHARVDDIGVGVRDGSPLKMMGW